MDLRDGLQAFRLMGRDFLQCVCGDVRHAHWDAAYDLIDALLSGVQKHLPEVVGAATVTVTPCDSSGSSRSSPSLDPLGGLALSVAFGSAPPVGEIATRSHLGCEVRLARTVRFLLLRPGSAPEEAPLV